MKKVLGLIFAVGLVLSMNLFGVVASAETPASDFEYEITESGVIITAYLGNAAEVVIPEQIEGKPVIETADFLFADTDVVSAVTFPDSVVTLGKYTFQNSKSIERVKFPSNIEVIPDSFLRNCSNLKSLDIPDSVKIIENNAVSYTGIEKLELPSSLITICDEALAGNNKILEIIVPEGVKHIGNYAFDSCWITQKVTLPRSLETIGENAFWMNFSEPPIVFCYKNTVASEYVENDDYLKDTIVYIDGTDEENTVSGKINELDWSLDKLTGVLTISGEGEMGDTYEYAEVDIPWEDYSSYIFSVEIEDGVTNICSGAFKYNYYNLASVTMPDSLKEIGYEAFSSCGRLKTVNFSNNLEIINKWAFASCDALTDITLPDSARIIEDEAFKWCSNLENISFGKNLTEIGDSAFEGCAKLDNISFPDSMEDIGYFAFNNTAIYNDSKNWENNVLYIDDFLVEIKDKIKGAFIVKNGTRGIAAWAFIGQDDITSIEFPNSLKAIGTQAFSYCEGLTVLEIPSSVTYMGRAMIYGCYNIEKLTVPFIGIRQGAPEEVDENILNYDVTFTHFVGYNEIIESLKEVVITEPCTHISEVAFLDCEYIKTIIVPDSVISVGRNAFSGASNLETIKLGKGVTDIQNIGLSSRHLKIIEISSQNPDLCAENNVVFNKDKTKLFLYPKGSTATSYIIPNSVKTIEFNSFSYAKNLVSVTIPNGVTEIGEDAFDNCVGLTSISIPGSVKTVGESAFNGCTGLTSVEFGEGTKTIGVTAFLYCTNIKEIVLPNGLESLGMGAFAYCVQVEKITIPQSLKNIGELAFYYCGNIKDVYYLGNQADKENIVIGSNNEDLLNATWHYGTSPCKHTYDDFYDLSCNTCGETLEYETYSDDNFGYKIFKGQAVIVRFNPTIKVANIPSTINGYPVTRIGERAFLLGTNLESVIIAEGITHIESRAFEGCANLKTISLPSTLEYIGEGAFSACESLVGIKIPAKVTVIEKETFAHCFALQTVELHNNITRIGDEAFFKCVAIKSIKMPENIESIGKSAFNGCYSNLEIWYSGTQIEKNNILIDAGNNPLLTAVWHYNTCEDDAHTYSAVCDASCNKCDWIRQAKSHNWNNATCNKAKTCNTCGTTSGSKLGHNSDSGSVTKKATCSATGTKVFKCTRCKATLKTETLPKLSHSYDSGKVTKKATCKATGVKTYTCKNCKATKTESIKKLTTHKYTNSCDTKCNVCSVTRSITHSYKITTTKATLTKNGSEVRKCTVCGNKTTSTIKYAKTIKLSATSYTYDGKVKKPSVTVKDSAGKTISSKYYTVSYATGRKNVGTYKVTIKFKGNYSGTKTLTFTINPPKTTAKLTAGKKALTVKVTKKTAQVSGYQIQYSTSKNFKSSKTVTLSKNTKTSTTIKKLTAKKTYYVRVRTYKTVGKTKYYSAWSTVVSKKTK